MLRRARLRRRRERRARRSPQGGQAELDRRWEIPGRPPCVRRRRRSGDGPRCHGCAAARVHRVCCRPKAARRLLPATVAGSTRPPALAPAAAHSRPRPNMAPRWVLTPEVAASMAASASRPMILSRPIPQPRAPASAKSLEVRLDGRGAGAERVGVHIVVAAGIDMADEAGLRPGLQFQQKAMDGAVADGPGIEHGACARRGMRPLRAECQERPS